jgi:hypothetical protein
MLDACCSEVDWAGSSGRTLRTSRPGREDTNAITVTPWIFAFEGLASEAEELAESKGVLWYDMNDFNELLDHVGLRKLPEL